MSGLISTWMDDRLGIPAAVDIYMGLESVQLIILLLNKNQISCNKSTSSRLITEVKQCRG